MKSGIDERVSFRWHLQTARFAQVKAIEGGNVG